MNRKDDVLLARLRFSQHPFLYRHLHHFDPAKDPLCLLCRLEEQECLDSECLGATKGCWSGLPFYLGMWWRTQGRLWSILTPNQVQSG